MGRPLPDINTYINLNTKDSLSEKNSDDENLKIKSQSKIKKDSPEYKISEYLFKKILKNNDKAKKPNLEVWAKSIEKMIRLDNREEQEIYKIIDFCQADPFWQTNILSTEKLRKQFDQLVIKSKQTKNNFNNSYNNKPSQATNYEQREYTDDYLNSLYDNVEFIK